MLVLHPSRNSSMLHELFLPEIPRGGVVGLALLIYLIRPQESVAVKIQIAP